MLLSCIMLHRLSDECLEKFINLLPAGHNAVQVRHSSSVLPVFTNIVWKKLNDHISVCS